MDTKINPEEISSILLKQLNEFENREQSGEIGVVIQSADGIARVHGLSQIMAGELVQFATTPPVQGLVLNLEAENIGVAILGEYHGVSAGTVVTRTKDIAKIYTGKQTLGRVIDPLGQPIDGGAPITSGTLLPIERKAPGIIERMNVNEPLETGIKAIDALIPVGKGQRELIIGDRKTGKTAIALDTILNQKDKGVYCIYVAIGQKASTVAALVNKLKEYGAMQYTTVVAANAADPACMQYLAPYAGITLGEYYRDNSMHSLVIMDDLTKHAQAYRQISLLLRRSPGREAYPGDVFYLHSRLLERAAKMSDKNGGGSLTAFPIIETQAGDISSYIPTNVISITDGQIYLDSNLFYSGIRPAIDVGLSVSRVGGDAQIKATKQVAGKLKLTLAQYREMAAFAQFASDLDTTTQKQLALGQRLTELLKQKQYYPYDIVSTILILYAGIHGHLNTIPLNQIEQFEFEFLNYADQVYGEIKETIFETKTITQEISQKLDEIILEYINIFMNKDA
jgi:F-type H+/Na+-transporting ATPase subunit alpha